ncbi:multidrug MFS transporter [Bacillus sp. FJAT-27225]|uniref:MDR family MFS transporter n=1 Tax=Bacillus sp. FJAT-27225 TaxID=1743144 RepID=UPI00080C26D1|nr:MFS transporter [Bacillus sp. FJAT-27225]OCA91436.1 multidrug MFS transporter [Bacillus sp. FJAT-27225]
MPRSLWLLIIGMVVNVIGSSFLWPLNSIYIHDYLGKSLSTAGFVLMLNSAASVAGNLVGGSLFDRLGGYKSILLGIGIALAALLGLTLWHEWPQYVIFLTLAGFGSGVIFPAMYAMSGSVWPDGGRRAFNAIYVAQNLGVAVGSALGGIVAGYSFELIFFANLIMYVLFFGIAFFGYKGIKVDSTAQSSVLQENTPRFKGNKGLHALLILCIGYLLCWVGYVQWQTTIASYTQEINVSLTQYSLLWTVNGALIVLGQPFLSAFLKWFGRSLKAQIILGMVIFSIAFIVAAYSNGFSGFMAGMIILTAGEMLIWPAVPAIASELSPKGREGFYQGIVNSTATGGRMIGPLLGGILVDLYGMSMLFTILILLFIISIGTTLIYDRGIRGQKQSVNVS